MSPHHVRLINHTPNSPCLLVHDHTLPRCHPHLASLEPIAPPNRCPPHTTLPLLYLFTSTFRPISSYLVSLNQTTSHPVLFASTRTLACTVHGSTCCIPQQTTPRTYLSYSLKLHILTLLPSLQSSPQPATIPQPLSFPISTDPCPNSSPNSALQPTMCGLVLTYPPRANMPQPTIYTSYTLLNHSNTTTHPAHALPPTS